MSPSPISHLRFKSFFGATGFMNVDQILQQEIKDSELCLSRTYEESIYKRISKKGLN